MESDTAAAGSAATDGPAPPFDRSKYKSPPPPPSSMTPPPSSQALQNSHSHARTPTPTHSHLSSPPPTVKAAPMQSGVEMAPGLYTAEQIADATMDELRNMLGETSAAYREARASAAHHSLQYNLLRLESQEIMNRMGVELEMTQKEVEVLQTTTQRGHGGAFAGLQYDRLSPAVNSPDRIVENLRNACHLLEVENERLQRRLTDAKSAILDREAAFAEENERLKERIRKNRQHLTLLRSSSVSQEAIQDMVPSTPQSVRAGQGRRPGQYASTGRGKNFDALLLAASQEAATTPSTPTTREPRVHRHGHARATHSLSSLPETPLQNSKAQSGGYGPYYVEPGAERVRSGKSSRPAPQSSRVLNQELSRPSRRRESRDSTISASDLDERQDVADISETEAESDEEIPASQASQEAATLLRKSASFRQATAPNSTQSSYSSAAAKSREALMQTKLPSYTIKKPDPRASSSKRKMRDDNFGAYDDARSAKQTRHGDGFGLGIGWPLGGR